MAYTILLADDERATLITNLTYLKELGDDHVVVGAPDGEIAFDLALKKSPDLIIIDWVMPKLTGLEVLEKIRAHEKTKDIPVIMVTAMASPKDLQEAFEKGVTDYIKKPVDKIELLSRARAALKTVSYFREIIRQQEILKEYNEQMAAAQAKLSELNTIKDIFFSVISSDLNEPLNSLTAFVNLLFKNINNFSKEEMKFVAENIRSALHNVSSLLKNLIAWSKTEVGNVHLLQQEVELYTLIEQIFLAQETSLSRKNILVEVVPNTTVTPRSDGLLFAAVFQIFSESIARFMAKNGSVSIVPGSLSNALIYVDFTCHGFRIAEKHLDNLFSLPYYMGTDINYFERGAGLGFVLCEKMLKRIMGKIQVIQGTDPEQFTFRICIPTSLNE
jgi:two-component system sensor histidine kinase/response regulator